RRSRYGPAAPVSVDNLRVPLLLLRGRWGRVALAVGAIAIAVAGIAAVDLVNRAVLEAFVAVIERATGPAALQVMGNDGALFPDGATTIVATIPGVKRAMPVLTTTAFTADDAGEQLTIYGLDVGDEATARLYQADGLAEHPLALLHADAILVTRRFAARRHLTVNDGIAIETPRGR